MTKLVFGLLLGLVAWTLIEQLVMWLRPSWLAPLSFVPLARRPVQLAAGDATKREWPRDHGVEGVELYPRDARSAWFRVGLEQRRRGSSGRTGVGRLTLIEQGGEHDGEHGGEGVLHARWFPALLVGSLGVVAVIVGVIVALAPWGVALVMSVLVLAAWSLPALTVQHGARARVEATLDRIAAAFAGAREPSPTRKARKKRSKRTKKRA